MAGAPQTTPWRHIGIALGLSLVGTGLLAGALLLMLDNIWWVAAGGILSLFSGGFYLGRGIGEPEPLYGAVLAAAYVVVAVVVILIGTFLAILPDPFPGLAIGDSTFFFVSPLLMLASGVSGTIVGGVMVSRQSQNG